jgi:nucleotide-binding universal stress UspA family protein
LSQRAHSLQFKQAIELRLMFRNLLVGVDGSERSDAALRRAIELARAAHGRIGLLSAVAQPTIWLNISPLSATVSRPALVEELEQEALRDLQDADRLVPADVPVTKLLARGDAAAALRAQAHAGPWDVVVVGGGPPARRRLGRRGVGASLLRSSPVPVLVVRAEPAVAPIAPEAVRTALADALPAT